jgi:hypothetical protein
MNVKHVVGCIKSSYANPKNPVYSARSIEHLQMRANIAPSDLEYMTEKGLVTTVDADTMAGTLGVAKGSILKLGQAYHELDAVHTRVQLRQDTKKLKKQLGRWGRIRSRKKTITRREAELLDKRAEASVLHRVGERYKRKCEILRQYALTESGVYVKPTNIGMSFLRLLDEDSKVGYARSVSAQHKTPENIWLADFDKLYSNWAKLRSSVVLVAVGKAAEASDVIADEMIDVFLNLDSQLLDSGVRWRTFGDPFLKRGPERVLLEAVLIDAYGALQSDGGFEAEFVPTQTRKPGPGDAGPYPRGTRMVTHPPEVKIKPLQVA